MNFANEFVKQKLLIKDSREAWRVAAEKYQTGLGFEFDDAITGKRVYHDQLAEKRKKYAA